MPAIAVARTAARRITVTEAVADFVGSATLTAATDSRAGDGTLLGAV